ncbi:MAG: hypothetical protein LBH47_00110 [Christensenellaceae bacterium]|nr:hypothetical protein [Christensenellaceae bacterium]
MNTTKLFSAVSGGVLAIATTIVMATGGDPSVNAGSWGSDEPEVQIVEVAEGFVSYQEWFESLMPELKFNAHLQAPVIEEPDGVDFVFEKQKNAGAYIAYAELENDFEWTEDNIEANEEGRISFGWSIRQESIKNTEISFKETLNGDKKETVAVVKLDGETLIYGTDYVIVSWEEGIIRLQGIENLKDSTSRQEKFSYII